MSSEYTSFQVYIIQKIFYKLRRIKHLIFLSIVFANGFFQQKFEVV